MSYLLPHLFRIKPLLMIAGLLLLPRFASGINLLVYNNHDSGPGSLRQALQDNAGLGGGNTILFSNVVTGTITLGSALNITASVTIIGPGAKVLTLSGNNSVRVFEISGGAVSIAGLTIANGFVSNGHGGGILSAPAGGLSPLTIQSCVFSNNIATGVSIDGGALYMQNPGTILNSTFCANHAWGSGSGGAIYDYGPLSISNCTFTANSATNAVGRGGAIFAFSLSGDTRIYNCTIVSNSAGFGGGGVQRFNNSTHVGGTIIAANSAPSDPDTSSVFASSGYNLIGNAGTSTGWNGVGDQIGSSGSPINPLIGPLLDNGGATPTMLPQSGSTAIDQGKSFSLTTDQRGRSRIYDNPAILNATAGDGTDIGAVELNYYPTLVVTNTNDQGDGSLRLAIAEVSSNGVIAFAAGVTGMIALTSGEIDAYHTGFSLVGPGAKLLTLSGNYSGRLFSLFDGTFNISGLTLANGRNTGQNGGRAGNVAISYPTVVNFHQCRITGGRSDEGGGIWNAGDLTLTACTLDNNFATNNGGAIFNYFLGRLFLTNCTVAQNAAFQACGLYNAGIATSRNCTIAHNGTGYTGGVVNEAAFTLASTLIASNSILDVYGLFNSEGYNLIGNTTNGTGFDPDMDQLNVNPFLGPLADYGGPTPTIALRAGSPVIDKGNSFGLTTDQRGFARTLNDPFVANADGGTDIGAFEVDPRFRIVELRRVGSDVELSWMTVLGRNYRVEYTNNLASGNWTSLTTNLVGNGYLLWVTNSGGANQPRRFYRGAWLFNPDN